MKAWAGVLRPLIPGRSSKPRASGLTMVIDKGLGERATLELLELAGEYIDILKLTFGTSAFYPADLLQRKNAACREHRVHTMPGGTSLEVALVQGNMVPFLHRARQLGFTAIEVSDGTVEVDARTRRSAIETARELGFAVISEVGKKHPEDEIPLSRMLGQIADDLEAGSEYVVVEGRESGKGIGIFAGDGRVKEADLDEMLEGIPDPGRVIWEAPLKDQQHGLIRRLGVNVNLGNVPPGDVLALEALRLGLRGDTLRDALCHGPGGAVAQVPVAGL